MIRKAQKNDAKAIRDVVVEAWEGRGDKTIRRRFTEETALNFLKGERNMVFVAEEHKEIVGVTMNYIDANNSRAGFISTIGTRVKYHGRGIASRLIRKSLQCFKARGVKRVFVRTESRNIPAQITYLKNGFTLEAVIRDYARDGVHWIWFGRYLK